MKTALKIDIIVIFSIALVFTSYANNGIDVLAKYYSQRLSLNLNHIMDLTHGLYYLSEESSFKKECLEIELNQLNTEIKYSNKDIANMIKYIPKENLGRLQKYLDNIDKHLAQVYVDIKSLRKNLYSEEPVNIPKLISDIYYQIKLAENEDHLEIKKIQNYMNYSLLETLKTER